MQEHCRYLVLTVGGRELESRLLKLNATDIANGREWFNDTERVRRSFDGLPKESFRDYSICAHGKFLYCQQCKDEGICLFCRLTVDTGHSDTLLEMNTFMHGQCLRESSSGVDIT